MSITIYSSGGTLKYTIPAIQASRLHQSLNGECLFDFSMPGRRISGIAIGDQVRLGTLWFRVCRIGKQTKTAGAEFAVSCEHVSYALADVEQEAAHFSGTTATVLAEILAGTGFSAGTVTVSGEWSITITQATNKRDALQRWAAACGAEISYSDMSINFLTRVGSPVPVLLSDAENVKALSVTLDSRSQTQTYGVELSRLQALGLGDAVTIRYSTLDLDVTTRVISLDYDPFHPWAINMTTGDYIPNFTGTVTAALEARLKEGQPYYGVTIDRETGIKIARSDGMSEAIFNSDLFTMRARIDGAMKDRIYFDPVKGDYVFDGALGADAVFTDALYADQGDIAELTVDELSTSRRVRKFILGDTSDDNFVHVKGQFVRWITGTVISNTYLATEDGDPILTESGYRLTEEVGNVATSQATNRYGEPLYWQDEPVGHTADGYPTDADGNRIYATTEQTIWPVTQYAYTELIKTQLAFEEMSSNYIPKLILGAGDEFGRSKGYLYKDEANLILRYNTRSNKNVDITFGDDGFVDAMHRRLASLILDTDSRTLVYQMEGDTSYYTLSYVINSDTITFTWPDGYVCDINIPDDAGGGGGGGGSSPMPSSALPQMDGTAAAGVGTLYSRGDHVHPTDTTRQAVITASGILKGNGSGGVSAAAAGTDYQAPLTFDSTPTEDSTNPVTSDGIYDAILDRRPNTLQIWSGNESVSGSGTTLTLDERWDYYTQILLVLNTATGNPSSSRMLVCLPTASLQFTGYWTTQNGTTSGIVRVGRPQYQYAQLVLYNIDFDSLYIAAVYGIK